MKQPELVTPAPEDVLMHTLRVQLLLDFAVLVGSRATGTAHARSDWDIALQWSPWLDWWLSTLSHTETLRHQFTKGATVNVLGLTFERDCPDLRNSKAPNIIRELESYGIGARVHDPGADLTEARHEYGPPPISSESLAEADAIVLRSRTTPIAPWRRSAFPTGFARVASLLTSSRFSAHLTFLGQAATGGCDSLPARPVTLSSCLL